MPITDNELNEMKNLQKKVEYYKDMLNENDGEHTPSEEDSDGEEVDEI